MMVSELGRLRLRLNSGSATSEELTEECLTRASHAGGPRSSIFRSVNPIDALRQARRSDQRRQKGTAGALEGFCVSVKDLFDVAGEQTTAGSLVLRDAPLAHRDSWAVSRLRRAGAVLVGRTNMSEFAYSGLGINPHFGTPLSPWGHDCVAGGSSSGAAASISGGMAHIALASDTGGSSRIPAAFCRLVGFKATRTDGAMSGAVPLAPSLDAVGWIVPTVACCARVGVAFGIPEHHSRRMKLRLGLPSSLVTDDLAPAVAAAFEKALECLSQTFHLQITSIPALSRLSDLRAGGGLPAAESFRWHARRLETHGDLYDPLVRARIQRGRAFCEGDLRDLQRQRAEFARRIHLVLESVDALIMPTVAILPPRLDALCEASTHEKINALCLRNTSIVNLFDGCAVTLPIGEAQEPPIGLMLAAGSGRDAHLLSIAALVEAALRKKTSAP